MPSFLLDQTLKADTFEITKLDLCYIGLMNDKRYPWLIMVPMRSDITEIIELQPCDQIQLIKEISNVSAHMKALFKPHKLNIAALGNVVRQLHIHVVARHQEDSTWPQPIWGHGENEPYGSEKEETINMLKSTIKKE